MGLFSRNKDDSDTSQVPQRTASNQPASNQVATMTQLQAEDAAPLSEQEHLKMMADANNSIDEEEQNEQPPPMPPRPHISLETNMSKLQMSSPPTTPSSANVPNSAISSFSNDSFSMSEISPLPSVGSPTSEKMDSPSNPMDKIKSNMRKHYDATAHFAGGLLSHPSESTKHFSILRHSNGLVFYQGSSTSVPISIFSDAPLQADNVLFLQSKGWSGNTGMAAKALVGRNGYWIDVTPSIQAAASQIDPVQEKAFQRDIAYFLKKADRHVRKTHVLRQTCLVRIPVEAGDGYFRLVLSNGPKRKVLCPSPVFRVLSTSISPSSIKGASLSTLPLEMGAMVVATAAKVTAFKAVAPVKLVAMAPVHRFMPGSLAKHAGKAAYHISGAGKKVDATVDDANARYDQLHETLFTEIGGAEATPDSGPVPPYPLEFLAAVEPGQGRISDGLAVPTMQLRIANDDAAHRLHGHYFGWVKLAPNPKRGKKSDPKEIPTSWYQAVISSSHTKASELARLHVSHTNHKTVTLTVVEDTGGISFAGANIVVKVMGFIRPNTSPTDLPNSSPTEVHPHQETVEQEGEAMKAVADMAMAQASLDRLAWGPEAVLERVPTEKSEKGRKAGVDNIKTRYAHTRMTVSRQVDRVPFYRAGLRVGADRLRDKAVGVGGIYVVRD